MESGGKLWNIPRNGPRLWCIIIIIVYMLRIVSVHVGMVSKVVETAKKV